MTLSDPLRLAPQHPAGPSCTQSSGWSSRRGPWGQRVESCLRNPATHCAGLPTRGTKVRMPACCPTGTVNLPPQTHSLGVFSLSLLEGPAGPMTFLLPAEYQNTHARLGHEHGLSYGVQTSS